MVTGNNVVGSFTGKAIEKTVIELCCATGEVRGKTIVGGLAGTISKKSVIRQRHTSVMVIGEESDGGLAGSVLHTAIIKNCYVLGRITERKNCGISTRKKITVFGFYENGKPFFSGVHLLLPGFSPHIFVLPGK